MNQRNVPGIDNAYLAMDTEEGVEVVWNEVMFSERKNFKLQEVGAIPGQRNWLCLKQLCALQYECNLYKNCYYNDYVGKKKVFILARN